MRDAHTSGTTDWANRVLATVSAHLGAGHSADVAKLAEVLDQAPWWDGCPTAIDVLPAGALAGYRRIPLVTAAAGGFSALLIAWPPGYSTPIHDHEGLWGIELVLDGVLEVEAFSLSLEPRLELVSRGTTLLGLGDHAAFSEGDYAHRCRNLSAHQPALSLHIYGGELEGFRAFHRDAAGHWDAVAHRVTRELSLT